MTRDTAAVQFTNLPGHPGPVELQWIALEKADRPLVVFLHEGLGSLAMWKDFPRTLCEAANARGLVHSRPGYGRSTAQAPDERWDVDYLHRQAYATLPAFLAQVGVDTERSPVWLLGHSDGASIALLFAARFPASVAGVIVLAPHLFVEPSSVQSIAAAREAYLHADLRERLSRYHDDVDAVFWRWNRIWLDPRFLTWNIESEAARIECQVLAIQGQDDEYGTPEQIHALQRLAPQTQVRMFAACKHSPHRDQPQLLLQHVVPFLTEAPTPVVLQ